MGRLFNPPHSGESLKEDALPVLSVTEAAKQLGITRTALSHVLNSHAAISPAMTRRIEARLGMQMDYDLSVAEQKPAPELVAA